MPNTTISQFTRHLSLGIAACGLAIAPALAETVMEEIVVTAQKREQNLQEVPISISQLAGDRLNARFAGGADILALASAAPGLHVESSNGRLSPRFYLRGLGNADFTAAASQPVSLVFDEVPMEKSSLKGFPVFDMADVEVIRGPQGTLFGRNTTAGIVHIKSKRPTEETEGYASLTLGSLGTTNAEAAIGGTLIEGKLLGRVSFMSQNRSDWVDNAYTGEKDAMGAHNIFAGRVQLLWTPTENFTAWVMHQRTDGESTTSFFRANVFDKGSNSLNSNYDRDTVWFDGGDGNHGENEAHGTTVKLDWNIGDYTLTSITAYYEIPDRFGRGDIDGGYGCLFTCGGIPSGPASTPFSPFNSPFIVDIDTGGRQEIEQFTQEIRLASNFDGAFNYQVGAFFFEDELYGISSSKNAGAAEFTPSSSSKIDNTTWAVFGQGSYQISDSLTITAGIRYTDDEKDADHIDFTGNIATVPISLDDDNISWDIAFSYFLDEQSQVYGRAASGFRAPTIQDRIQDDVEVTTADSETIQSFEIGYKATFQRARINIAAFHYEIDDMQLVAVGGTSNSTALLNAKEGVGSGIEFEFEYLVTDNLIISGGYGYNKTEINDSSLSIPGGPLVTLRDPLDANGFALIDGNPFQHAPEWTANIELDYTRALSDDAEFYLFTDWRFKGETQDFLYESEEYTFDTQHEGGLRMGYRNLSNDWELGVFARNITDEDNPIGGIDFANNTGYVNEPRIWGAEFRMNF